jgi:hypothetical protein
MIRRHHPLEIERVKELTLPTLSDLLLISCLTQAVHSKGVTYLSGLDLILLVSPPEVAPASKVKDFHRRTEGNSVLMKKAFRA